MVQKSFLFVCLFVLYFVVVVFCFCCCCCCFNNVIQVLSLFGFFSCVLFAATFRLFIHSICCMRFQNILFQNTTKVKNVTLVLKHSLDSVAVLQHLHVRGPSSKEPGSSTKPLKNGIVFACKTTPDLHRLEIFNDCLSADEFQV